MFAINSPPLERSLSMNNHLLIYSPKFTSRSSYVFRLIFEDLLGLELKFTSERFLFERFQGAKLNYSMRPFGHELHFQPAGLLYENGVVWQELSWFDWNGYPAFFKVGLGSAWPFDPFAATFYLVSRYEEYYPHVKDEHQRFRAEQSVAYQQGFLQIPLVNIWAKELGTLLCKHYPELSLHCPVYKFIPSIDIDNAFAILEKGLVRVASGLIKDLLSFNGQGFKDRIKVLFRLKTDPFDTYEYQIDLVEKYNLHMIYFVLLGDYNTYDKNVPHYNRTLHSLIKFLDDYGDVGIHPSYASNTKPTLLKKEIARLQSILHRDIHHSRQHYLKLSIPSTYQRLLECEITDDHTMGYPSQPGFRASICSPFFFYDLDLETETRLKIHPFALMDGTLKDYLKLSPEKTSAVYTPLISEVKKVGGQFVVVWHNESFAENERWKGWRAVFEDIIHKALPD